MSKRYVLLVADADLSGPEMKMLRSVVERRHPGDKLIEIQGNRRAVIVRTTNEVAPSFRTVEGAPTIDGKRLNALLTSGAVGNLKRRVTGAGTNGQVHE